MSLLRSSSSRHSNVRSSSLSISSSHYYMRWQFRSFNSFICTMKVLPLGNNTLLGVASFTIVYIFFLLIIYLQVLDKVLPKFFKVSVKMPHPLILCFLLSLYFLYLFILYLRFLYSIKYRLYRQRFVASGPKLSKQLLYPIEVSSQKNSNFINVW